MGLIKKIDSYLLKHFLGLLAMTFMICVFILLMQFVWMHIKDLVGKGVEISVLAEFFVYADNPVLRIYQRFIKCYGGRQVGYLARSSYFDGKYHDAIIFEILKEEFKA